MWCECFILDLIAGPKLVPVLKLRGDAWPVLLTSRHVEDVGGARGAGHVVEVALSQEADDHALCGAPRAVGGVHLYTDGIYCFININISNNQLQTRIQKIRGFLVNTWHIHTNREPQMPCKMVYTHLDWFEQNFTNGRSASGVGVITSVADLVASQKALSMVLIDRTLQSELSEHPHLWGRTAPQRG